MTCLPGFVKPVSLLKSQPALAFFMPEAHLHHENATSHRYGSSFDLF